MASDVDFKKPLDRAWWARNWRIVLLTTLIVASAVALFAPMGDSADAGAQAEIPGNETEPTEETVTDSGLTNLVFGLELAGGTRVRAPLTGITAEGLAIHPDDSQTVENDVASELGIDGIDVQVQTNNPDMNDATVEVFDGNVTHGELAAALQASGVEADEGDVRDGVTAETRETAVNVLDSKIDESGLAGGSVFESQASGGEHFIIVEVPGEDRDDVISLIEERGAVQIIAGHPVEGENGTEYHQEPLLDENDFASIDHAQNPSGQPPNVPVVLTAEAGDQYADYMNDHGFTAEGVGACAYDLDEDDEPDVDSGYCLYTVVDDEIVYAASMGGSLADSIRTSTFKDVPQFQMETTSMDDARLLQINLQAGSLPAPMDMDSGTVFFLEPSLAEDFKIFSLLIGIIAALSVCGMVYVRYRDVRVAVPMLLTASAEVIILLGFSAAIGLPLDLAYIAGFIAVIGTGVDDLIIIADEVLAQGDVRTNRVFRSRFRKALWVIGAAAATTIIAMSPLAIMSLGDLRGFAIITIIGVLIGVFITRPAYGDILRALMIRQ